MVEPEDICVDSILIYRQAEYQVVTLPIESDNGLLIRVLEDVNVYSYLYISYDDLKTVICFN